MCCVIGSAPLSPIPRRAHESVLVQDKLLVWGGRKCEGWKPHSRSEFCILDLLKKQWSITKARIPTDQDEPPPCGQARCAVVNNVVYSFGGYYMIDGGKFCRLGEIFSLVCEEMMWRKLETRGNKPVARDSHGLCAVGGKLVMFGGAISHADSEKLPAGAQYKSRIPVSVSVSEYGYTNDCWEFCPREGNRSGVFVIV